MCDDDDEDYACIYIYTLTLQNKIKYIKLLVNNSYIHCCFNR